MGGDRGPVGVGFGGQCHGGGLGVMHFGGPCVVVELVQGLAVPVLQFVQGVARAGRRARWSQGVSARHSIPNA